MRKLTFIILFFSYSLISNSQIIDVNTGINFSGVTYTDLQRYGYYVTDGVMQSVIYPDKVKYKSYEVNLVSIHGSCINAIFNKLPFMIGDYLGLGVATGYISSNSKYDVQIVTSNMYNGSRIVDKEQIVDTHLSFSGYIDYGFMMRIRPSEEIAFGINRYYHHTYSRMRTGETVTPVVTSLWGGFYSFFAQIGMNLSKDQKYFNGSYFNLDIKNRIGDYTNLGFSIDKIKYEGINYFTIKLEYGITIQ